MKRMLLLLVLVALFAVMSVCAAQTHEGWIEEKGIPSCVAVVTDSGLGTGVFASPDGYIVTCRHVVANAESIVVYTHDFRKYKARVVGFHSDLDIAVLKIEIVEPQDNFELESAEARPEECEYTFDEPVIAKLGKVYVGQTVYAVGMPLGLAWTVTKGIVSQRVRTGDGKVYWQTDASINPGNSGGPLIDESGKLVGINSIGIPAFMAENIAFSIAAFTWIDEVQLLIREDRERLGPIGDVNKYLEEKSKAKKYYGGHYYK